MLSVVSLAFYFDPHTSPPTERSIRKALRTQISPEPVGGEIRYFVLCCVVLCCVLCCSPKPDLREHPRGLLIYSLSILRHAPENLVGTLKE